MKVKKAVVNPDDKDNVFIYGFWVCLPPDVWNSEESGARAFACVFLCQPDVKDFKVRIEIFICDRLLWLMALWHEALNHAVGANVRFNL